MEEVFKHLEKMVNKSIYELNFEYQKFLSDPSDNELLFDNPLHYFRDIIHYLYNNMDEEDLLFFDGILKFCALGLTLTEYEGLEDKIYNISLKYLIKMKDEINVLKDNLEID